MRWNALVDFKLDRTAMTVTTLDKQGNDDLSYWLSRPQEERLAAVEFLRRQMPGTGVRLRRILTVIEWPYRKSEM